MAYVKKYSVTAGDNAVTSIPVRDHDLGSRCAVTRATRLTAEKGLHLREEDFPRESRSLKRRNLREVAGDQDSGVPESISETPRDG
jgi:hypothetical protein